MNRLRGQIAELILLPAAACLLPWSWLYRIVRVLSRLPWLYREATDQAEAAAERTGLFEPDRIWRRHYRINRLVDGIDLWLSPARGDRWMDRNLDVKGAWPVGGPFVATSLHWGTGVWALRHVRRHAGPIAMILRPEAEWHGAFSWPMRRYLRSCERWIASAGGAPIMFTGPGLTARLSDAFTAGTNLLALVDVPKGANQDGFPVEFLGRPTYFASGVINIAVEQGIPIVPYSIGLDFATGRRRLEILPPVAANDTREVMAQLAAYFDRVVRRQSASWHFWPFHRAFLSPDFIG
jgi:hypothetical protein